jgi:hypothetical protein
MYNAFQFAHVVLKILCYIVDYILWDVKTVFTYEALENVVAQLNVRCLQFGKHTPLESCEHTLLHILQLYGRAVACHDNLTSVKVQVVEDVEECFQSLLLAGELLHVVYDKTIDTLVEMYEIVGLVVYACIYILNLENVGGNIKYTLLGVFLA